MPMAMLTYAMILKPCIDRAYLLLDGRSVMPPMNPGFRELGQGCLNRRDRKIEQALFTGWQRGILCCAVHAPPRCAC